MAIERATEFNERVQLDGSEVILTDGSSAYLSMILDEASKFGLAMLPHAGRAISAGML